MSGVAFINVAQECQGPVRRLCRERHHRSTWRYYGAALRVGSFMGRRNRKSWSPQLKMTCTENRLVPGCFCIEDRRSTICALYLQIAASACCRGPWRDASVGRGTILKQLVPSTARQNGGVHVHCSVVLQVVSEMKWRSNHCRRPA